MKKLIAISLLALHLFNLAGYSLVFDYFIGRSDEQFIIHINNDNFDENRLVEIKIPLNLPYMQGSFDYERFDGTVEHDGVQYNYVKRRVFEDTLSVLCLPNDRKTSMVKESKQLSNELNDFPSGKKGKQASIKKPVCSGDFFSTINDFALSGPLACRVREHTPCSQSLLPVFITLPERPPCFNA